jgi:peptide/nickel transport system permease protein
VKYLLQRIGFYIFTLWAAITINFFIPRLTPGDPVQAVMASFGGQLDPHAIQSLTVLFGLDKHQSLWQQYTSYLAQLSHGDLGISFHNFPTPVTTVLGEELPWTLTLLGVTTLLAFTIGTLLGVLAGWRRGGWADNLIPATTFVQSIPYFFLALLAVNFLATGTDSFFPSSGGYDNALTPGWSGQFIGSAIQHSLLPALTILVTSVAGWILGMRNMMVTTTAEDYITVAHAKGLSERRVALSYAARNALLPSVSGFGMALGLVVSGAFLVEAVFSYPGIGEELVTSIGQKDYPMLQGIFLVVTISVLVANLIADIVYTLLDPRTRKEG